MAVVPLWLHIAIVVITFLSIPLSQLPQYSRTINIPPRQTKTYNWINTIKLNGLKTTFPVFFRCTFNFVSLSSNWLYKKPYSQLFDVSSALPFLPFESTLLSSLPHFSRTRNIPPRQTKPYNRINTITQNGLKTTFPVSSVVLSISFSLPSNWLYVKPLRQLTVIPLSHVTYINVMACCKHTLKPPASVF